MPQSLLSPLVAGETWISSDSTPTSNFPCALRQARVNEKLHADQVRIPDGNFLWDRAGAALSFLYLFTPVPQAGDPGLWGCPSSPTAARGEPFIAVLITLDKAQTLILLCSAEGSMGSNCFMGFFTLREEGERCQGTDLLHICLRVNPSRVPRF